MAQVCTIQNMSRKRRPFNYTILVSVMGPLVCGTSAVDEKPPEHLWARCVLCVYVAFVGDERAGR